MTNTTSTTNPGFTGNQPEPFDFYYQFSFRGLTGEPFRVILGTAGEILERDRIRRINAEIRRRNGTKSK